MLSGFGSIEVPNNHPQPNLEVISNSTKQPPRTNQLVKLRKATQERQRERHQEEATAQLLAEYTPTTEALRVDPDGYQVVFPTVPNRKPTGEREDYIGFISREDSCVCCYGGELAGRLVAALLLGDNPDSAKAAFLSTRVWPQDTWKLRYKEAKAPPLSQKAAQLQPSTHRTQLSPKFVEKLSKLSKRAWCVVSPKSSGIPKGFPLGTCSWVSSDGSCCGVGWSPSFLSWFSSRGFPFSFFLVATKQEQGEPSSSLLGSLVFLSPSSLVGPSGVRVWASFSVCFDLCVGFFPPGFLGVSLGAPLRLPLSVALAASPSPFRFLSSLLLGVSKEPKLQTLEELSGTKGLFFFSSVDPSEPSVVGWGSPSGVAAFCLSLGVPPSSLLAAPLTWRSLRLLFGPPLHLLSPLPANELAPLGLVFRLSPSCLCRCPEPAELDRQADQQAQELFQTAAPGEWLGANRDPPRREVGPLGRF